MPLNIARDAMAECCRWKKEDPGGIATEERKEREEERVQFSGTDVAPDQLLFADASYISSPF